MNIVKEGNRKVLINAQCSDDGKNLIKEKGKWEHRLWQLEAHYKGIIQALEHERSYYKNKYKIVKSSASEGDHEVEIVDEVHTRLHPFYT